MPVTLNEKSPRGVALFVWTTSRAVNPAAVPFLGLGPRRTISWEGVATSECNREPKPESAATSSRKLAKKEELTKLLVLYFTCQRIADED